jgi:multicomponent Na+:H+ antiporter subunit C
MMTGFYIVIARSNLIQKVIGLNIFQISVFLLYITMGKVTGGTAPIFSSSHETTTAPQQFTHPLPSVLILTAIVVGVATTSLALALTVRIREEYGTIEEDEILQMDCEPS